MLNTPATVVEFNLSWHWLSTTLGDIWQPFLLGCFTVSTITSLAAFLLVHGLWRLHIISHLKQRRLRRLVKKRRSARE